MEEWGSGYKRVLNACSKGGYPEPEWAEWNISQKTAQRDIADLKQKGLIEFSGAPKNGYYRLKS